MPPDTLIGVISSSAIILRQAEAVLRAIYGEDILIRTVLYREEPLSEIQQLARHAKLILADYGCIADIQSSVKITIQSIQTIPEHEIQKLRLLCAEKKAQK